MTPNTPSETLTLIPSLVTSEEVSRHYKKVAEAAAAAPEQWQATLDITAARLACDLEIAEAEAALHLAEIQVSTDATSDGKSAAGGIIEGLELARVRHKLGQISGGVVVAESSSFRCWFSSPSSASMASFRLIHPSNVGVPL